MSITVTHHLTEVEFADRLRAMFQTDNLDKILNLIEHNKSLLFMWWKFMMLGGEGE